LRLSQEGSEDGEDLSGLEFVIAILWLVRDIIYVLIPVMIACAVGSICCS